jgi:hypothetical protein
MFFALALITLGLAFANRAHATTLNVVQTTGYVCQSSWVVNPVQLQANLSNTGTYGIVYSYLYSQPNCQGTQLGFAYFCTSGATNSTICALGQLMNEYQAQTLVQSLQHAGAAGQKVSFYTLVSTTNPNIGVFAEFTQP